MHRESQGETCLCYPYEELMRFHGNACPCLSFPMPGLSILGRHALNLGGAAKSATFGALFFIIIVKFNVSGTTDGRRIESMLS